MSRREGTTPQARTRTGRRRTARGLVASGLLAGDDTLQWDGKVVLEVDGGKRTLPRAGLSQPTG